MLNPNHPTRRITLEYKARQGGDKEETKEGPEPHKNHLKPSLNHPNAPTEAPKSFSKMIPAMAHELVCVAFQESRNEQLEVSTLV